MRITLSLLSIFVVCAYAQLASPALHLRSTPHCTGGPGRGLRCSGIVYALQTEPAFAFLSAQEVLSTSGCRPEADTGPRWQLRQKHSVRGPLSVLHPPGAGRISEPVPFTLTIGPAQGAAVCPPQMRPSALLGVVRSAYRRVVLHIQQPVGDEVITYELGTKSAAHPR